MAIKTKEDRGTRTLTDLVLDLYSNLFQEVWEVVSALIGETILAVLFIRAIKELEGKYPFLAWLKVSEEGLLMDELKKHCRGMSPIDIHRGFQGMTNHLSQLFSSLAEGVINKELFPKIFPKVKEAERIIFQKKE